MTEQNKIESTTGNQSEIVTIPISNSENKTIAVTKQEESIEEINWRKFRQQREEDRKQKEAAIQAARQKEIEAEALKKAMEALVNKPTATYQQQEEETEEQRIERKVQQLLEKKEIENERKRMETERMELPQRLQSNFRDFNEICTSENLDYLEYHYPEIAKPYKTMPEGYDKWEGIYQALKKFVPNKNGIKEMKKVEANLAKPQAISKPGLTQTGDHAPNLSLTEDRKRANWERMQKTMGKGGIG